MKPSAFLRVSSLLLGVIACVGLLSASVTQEVPRGSLHIVVTMKENGKPLPGAWVSLTSLTATGETEVPATSVTGEELQAMHQSPEYEFHRYKTNKNGEITATNISAGYYRVEADAKAHNATQKLVDVEEAKKTDYALALDPVQPYLELYASQRVFAPGDKASFEIRGFERGDKATVRYYKLDLDKIAEKGGLSTLLYSFSRPGNVGGGSPAKSATSSEQFDKKLTSKDLEGVFTEPVTMPSLDEGFYYVTCKVGDDVRGTYLNISQIGLVTKTSDKQSLCYVADIDKGTPVEGAAIQASNSAGFHKLAETDKNGLARVTMPTGGGYKNLLLATHGKSQAVVDFDNETSGSNRNAKLFMYSDRPIYRPGDTIQFKGIVRKLQGLSYSLPASGTVDITIRDTSDTEVKDYTLPLSEKGAFNGSFTSNVEDKPGAYSIVAKYNGASFTYYAGIADYRKPEYSITVTSAKKYYIYGDRAAAKVKVEYYFGGPVVGAKVEASITRRAQYDYDDESDYADYADEGDQGDDYGGTDSGQYYNQEFQGEYDETVEAVTDGKGEATIQFDTKTDDDPDIPDYDLDYSVNASVTDASNKYFEGSGDVPVMRGDVSANLSTDTYIADPGDTVNAKVTVKRQDDKSPVANWPVSLIVGTEEWNDNNDESTFVPSATLTGVTDAKGVATIPVNVTEEGSLVLKSTVNDSAGRPVKCVDYIYVEGDRMFGPPTAKFTVTLDKKSYKVGDSCKVLVQTDKPGGAALITVQAEKVLATYVVNLTKQATIFSIPVAHDYAPNVWISATLIKNKQLTEAQSKLVVNLKEHDLTIEVTPDKPDYLPGATANLTIKTTDFNGQPVPADLSLGVVDESIYAIQPDTTDIKGDFYPMRADDVRTNYSFEDIYLDGGDKAGGKVPLRTKFLDTASWQPTIETGPDGIAHTSIKLPDNLTSWRATAIGVTDSTEVGMTHINFRASKPLSVRLELPSFLVQQDTQTVTAIITNDTGKDQVVNMRLDAQGVTYSGSTLQKVTVTAAKPLAVTYNVQTPQPGTADFEARVWVDGSSLSDGQKLSVNIEPHGRLRVEDHSGEIKGTSTVVNFDLSKGADPKNGRLILDISPSIGATIYQSLDDLIDFPYGCVEQTMSRFLPTVVLSSTLKELNIRSDLQAKVPDIVADGFARLAKMQHSDGAWGWWEYDGDDQYMTAYVLDGLARAKASGFRTNKIDEKQAVEWAKKELIGGTIQKWGREDFLYLCYAAAEYGVKHEVRAGLERAKPKDAADYALVALAYHEVGDKDASDRALIALHDQAMIDGDVAYFNRDPWDYGYEYNGFPLMALTTLMPDDPLIPKLVRYLVADRRGDIWYSTRDTSLVLIGLTKYLRESGDTGKPMDIDLIVNGGAPKRIHFDPADQFNPALKVTIPISKLQAGQNRIEFRKVQPEGLCFYSGDLRQIDLAEQLLPEESAGLSVTRTYHLLEPQQMEDGKLELRPTKRSIDQAKPGDLIRVQLTISSSEDRQFIMIEDPIPSGCRITEREYVDDGEQWSNWWSQTIVLDDKAAFFMRELPKGIQILTYTMRAEQLGTGHALPPTISNMYDPTVSASGGENLLQVSQ